MKSGQQDWLITRMKAQVEQWRSSSDDKALFLDCYLRMTGNMLGAIEKGGFDDGAWVKKLLQHFAEYYFNALESYRRDPASAPAVWQRAHGITPQREVTALQKMLLGINAHINYDLVLTLDDLLHREWKSLSSRQRTSRYEDYIRVNEIIALTIDEVQDEVLEPAMPVMDIFDRLLGRVDEFLISRLINNWRDEVWENAGRILASEDTAERSGIVREVEKKALRTANIICRRS